MKNRFFKLSSSFLISSFIIHMCIPNILYAQDNKIRVIKKDAVLRLKPNSESIIIKNLPLGSELYIVETMEEWIKINLPPDKDGFVITGYIHKSFIEFETTPAIEKKTELSIEKEDKYFSWQKELAHARAKQNTGTILAVFGSLIIVPSMYFVLRGPSEGNYYYTWTKIGLGTGIVIGSLSIVIGMTNIQSGRTLENQLKREGEARGYLKAGLLPKYKAVGIQIGVSF